MSTQKAQVMQYLESHPGKTLHLGDMAADLNLTNMQVSTAISFIRRDGSLHEVEQVGKGIYRYRPTNGKPSSELYEKVGVTKTGALVIQDENGRLYKAEELT